MIVCEPEENVKRAVLSITPSLCEAVPLLSLCVLINYFQSVNSRIRRLTENYITIELGGVSICAPEIWNPRQFQIFLYAIVAEA